MNLNHFYHYYKSKSGGVSNLLLGSEELDQSDQGEWVRYNMNAVNANVPGVANPLSSDETVEQLDFEASTVARIAQTVTLTAGTEYTFSVWARAASGTKPFRLRYWDNVGGSGGGSAFTASATWSASTGRYEMTFTAANSGTFQMFIQNAGGTAVSRRIYFWGAMLNVGASALDYVKTEFPAGPSNPPTAPMEFGDNFANVTAYYSLRRFTKGEDNNAIRVRRSSDDTEQDIGFDANGDLDTAALLAFVGTGGTDNGFVTTFYDQSGNGNDATNSTETEQPLVVSGGALVTETNGLPAISWESNDLALFRIPWNSTSSQSWFGVFNPLNDSYIAISEIPAGGNRDWVVQNGSVSTGLQGFDNTPDLYINSDLQSPTTRDDLHTAFSTQGNVLASTIDVNINTWDDGSQWYFFGNGGGVSNLFNYSGRVQEWIVFESDQETNRTGIETNINDHFDIYT